MISEIIKVEVNVISLGLVTETLITPDITKIESNNCFIIHCFEITTNTPSNGTDLTLLSGFMHCRGVQPTD